jgi:myo-inositol-1(or 4)-monophosphatase
MLKPAELDLRYSALLEIAKEAGALGRKYFADLPSLKIELKGLQDQVSAADRDVEALIKKRVAEQFPDDVCLGEEYGGKPGHASWVIDPIDGTGNFVRGYPHWAVSIGFIVDGTIELGAVYDPSADRMFAAQHGRGATLNGAPMRVRTTEKTQDSVICVGFSHSSPKAEFIDAITKLIDAGCEFRRVGSAALGLAHVAAGHFDAFWQKKLSSWDVLAGILLVNEAGGRTNNFLANEGLVRGNTMLGACPGIYSAVAAATGTNE